MMKAKKIVRMKKVVMKVMKRAKKLKIILAFRYTSNLESKMMRQASVCRLWNQSWKISFMMKCAINSN